MSAASHETTPSSAAPRAGGEAATSGAPSTAPRHAEGLTGSPSCPQCGGRMWDNRLSKRNAKAPDFKCRDRRCGGVVWPGAHHAAEPILARPRVPADGLAHTLADAAGDAAVSDSTDAQRPDAAPATPSQRPPAVLRACYLGVTDFVLAEVRPKYAAAGVPCTDATVAAIAATLFIGLCKSHGQERGR